MRPADSALRRALAKLDEEVTSSEQVLDFLDKLEVLASTISSYALSESGNAKADSIDEVLQTVGRKNQSQSLSKLGKDLTKSLRNLRRAAYGDDGVADSVSEANEVRERIQVVVRQWIGE